MATKKLGTDQALNTISGRVVNSQFRKLESAPAALDTMDAYYQQAYAMISSQAVRDAFDMSKESDAMKERYGMGKFLEPREAP